MIISGNTVTINKQQPLTRSPSDLGKKPTPPTSPTPSAYNPQRRSVRMMTSPIASNQVATSFETTKR